MVSSGKKKNVSMRQVLAALMDDQAPFPATYLHHLSDLEGMDLAALHSVWPQVHANRRYGVLEDLEELVALDTLVSFNAIARMALPDPHPRVRAVAIRLLNEDEDVGLASIFMQMLEQDPDVGVRAEAAAALGRFVYRGELEEIPLDIFRAIENRLIETANSSEDALIRRRALESLGFSGREEVPALIRQAYQSGNEDWIASALFAISRSADSAWEPEVKRMLRHPRANVQVEAVRAAGELELDSTRRILLDLLEEEAQDSDIRAAVIWSLSQIGGDEVRDTFETLLEETEDEEELELLSDALDNLNFTEDMGMFTLLDMDEIGQANREIDDIESYLTSFENDDLENTKETGNRDSGGDDDGSITKRGGKSAEEE
jgi:hypothetical protein